MTRSNPPNFSRQILLLAAGIFLLAAPQGALAKHKDHSDDHSGMSSNDSNDNKDKYAEKDMKSDKDKGKHKADEYSENGMSSDKHKGKHKDDEESAENGMSSDKHKGKHKHDEESAEKTKDKTPGSTTANNDTSGTGGKPAESPTNGGTVPTGPTPGTPAPATPAPVAVNTIHPIASPPPHMVTLSDGTNTFQMPDGAGGVTVTSHGPGQITVSNGVQTQTLHGIKVTISGALGVGVPKSIGTGPRQADGSVVVLSPNGSVGGGPCSWCFDY
jgi:hypothetical protein